MKDRPELYDDIEATGTRYPLENLKQMREAQPAGKLRDALDAQIAEREAAEKPEAKQAAE